MFLLVSINILRLGPVFVEFPIDVLYPYSLIRKEAGIKVSNVDFVHTMTDVHFIF